MLQLFKRFDVGVDAWSSIGSPLFLKPSSISMSVSASSRKGLAVVPEIRGSELPSASAKQVTRRYFGQKC
jgi:hypothetical protein